MKKRNIQVLKLCAMVVLAFLVIGGNSVDKEKITEQTFVVKPIGSVQKEGKQTTLVLDKEYEPGLLGLDGFSHVWVFWWFDQNDTAEKRSILQVHPRADKKNPLTGVFATRAPVRPNLIAQTLCKIISVKGNVVEIEWIDAFAETPILDMKPYISGSDVADAKYPDWL